MDTPGHRRDRGCASRVATPSITAGAPQIRVHRPVLVPQVATQQLILQMMIKKLQADAAVVQSVENFAEEPWRVWSGVDRIISKGSGVSSPTVSLGEKLSDMSDPSSLELIFLRVELLWVEENILDGHCLHNPGD